MEKELEERELKELELMNENENREFYVYVHIRLDNNTVFYVGKGTGNRAYKIYRGEGTHHDNICKACGCKAVIIKDNLTESQAFRLESKMIKYYVHTLGYGINIEGYNNYDHKLPHLTNCTFGGEGTSGFKFSEESKRKKSESMKGKMVGEKHPMWGKNPYANKTEEEKETIRRKISEAVSGEKNGMFGKKGKDSPVYGEKNGMWGKNPYANKTEEEMEIICKKKSKAMKGKMVGEKNPMWGKNPYANKTEEEKETIRRKISEKKKGKPSHNKGKKGLFHHSEESKRKMSEKKKGKPACNRIKVKCITTGKTFDCIKDASDHYHINKSSIVSCCKGTRKSAGKLNGIKLQWKYAENDDNNDLKVV